MSLSANCGNALLVQTSCDDGARVLVTPQDLRLPCPLHRRVQHGSRRSAEAPGPLLERPRHPAPVRPTQRLLRLRIDASHHRQIQATREESSSFSVGIPADARAGPFFTFCGQVRCRGSWDVVKVAVSLCPALCGPCSRITH